MAESRTVLGDYLGTHADKLIYTLNVTLPLNIVARSLELKPCNEVLATDQEYGATDRTWHFLSKENGFRYITHHIELPLAAANSSTVSRK